MAAAKEFHESLFWSDQLAKKNKHLKIIHHKTPKGMGYCYREGLKLAKYKYYMYIPGDNQFPGKALKKMLRYIGETDIIIPFVTNMNIRPLARQWISALFTFLINLLFSLNIKYYNGTVIHRVKLLKKALPKTDGHAYQAEILVRLIKSGATYSEVGYEMVERRTGLTSAFKLKNVKSVFKAILTLENESECKKFLRDLLTEAEIKEFANRWKVANMLNQKIDYKTIEKETNMSSATIARISKWLTRGKGGYRLMLKKLASHHNRPKLAV